MLETFASVERALARYADHFQPRSGSFTAVRTTKASPGDRDPFGAAFLDRLGERTELRRRMSWLDDEEGVVLLRWYVQGSRPEAIASELDRSVRHVYRRRTSAIERLVALGHTDEFEDVDVSEFV